VQRLFPLILVSLTAHIGLVGARVTTSLYALSLHASEWTVGTLIALFALFPMVCAVPMGRLIDRIGVEKPLLTGGAMMVAGCLIPCGWDSLLALYLAAMFIGTGFLAIHLSIQHAVGRLATQELIASFSWLALGTSVSSFLGPIIVGVAIDHARHEIAYAICSGFALLSLGVMVRYGVTRVCLPVPHQAPSLHGVFDLLRDPDMRRIYLMSVLLGSAWDLFGFVMPIHGTRLGFSASTIGVILGCFSAATFAVRLAMPWISRRYSAWQVLTTALALAMGCYTLLPLMKDAWSIMLVTATLGLALGSSQPNVLALLHQTSPSGRAGEAVGVRVTISNACQVALPLAFGVAGTAIGLVAVFWAMGVMIATGIPIAWRKALEKHSDA